VDRVIADTDALVDFIEGAGAAAQVDELLAKGNLATTAVNVYELFRGCESDDERSELRLALRGVRVYPVNDPAAKRAAEVDRELARRGLRAAVCVGPVAGIPSASNEAGAKRAVHRRLVHAAQPRGHLQPHPPDAVAHGCINCPKTPTPA
jgi:predicted nucleic acid-binding protein